MALVLVISCGGKLTDQLDRAGQLPLMKVINTTRSADIDSAVSQSQVTVGLIHSTYTLQQAAMFDNAPKLT